MASLKGGRVGWSLYDSKIWECTEKGVSLAAGATEAQMWGQDYHGMLGKSSSGGMLSEGSEGAGGGRGMVSKGVHTEESGPEGTSTLVQR